PNQRRFDEDRGFIDWLDFMEIISSHQLHDLGLAIFRRYVDKLGILPIVGSAARGKREALVDSLRRLSKSFLRRRSLSFYREQFPHEARAWGPGLRGHRSEYRLEQSLAVLVAGVLCIRREQPVEGIEQRVRLARGLTR